VNHSVTRDASPSIVAVIAWESRSARRAFDAAPISRQYGQDSVGWSHW
jgi:hypothetical protein